MVLVFSQGLVEVGFDFLILRRVIGGSLTDRLVKQPGVVLFQFRISSRFAGVTYLVFHLSFVFRGRPCWW